MSCRCPELPFLPGYTFNPNIGKTKFPLIPTFDYLGPGNRAIIEKVRPNMMGPLSDKYPSIYPRGETIEIPGWVAFDKKTLVFHAYFQQTLQEVKGSPFQIRKCRIMLYLEDGTIQVYEPPIENSGLTQGTLIGRQKIRFPPPMDDNFYDILDFNIGKEVEFYGRVFKIVDCDKFTRTFLNRCGITVPDPIVTPADPFMELRRSDKLAMQPKKPKRRAIPSLQKFINNDKKVLLFKGYWDDQKTTYGYLHHLDVRYYLADDTIEIREVQTESCGDPSFIFLKRDKLPKVNKDLPAPGYDCPETILNVLGNTQDNRRYILDPLDCGREKIDYYCEKDLSIGAILNCYGRQIVLVDCDSFTKEYYASKYGISEFTPLPIPAKKKHEIVIPPPKQRELPPWNGFGSHEDSAQNCVTVEPKPPFKDFKKFLQFDRQGMDSHILRFAARMKHRIPENCDRYFNICFHLGDDNISIYERPRKNSGFKQSCFLHKMQVKIPGQKYFSSKPPLIYTAQHMFIGATLILNEWEFILVDADEYALRYMEINCDKFPKANIKLIMDKVREKLRPIYKDFVAENVPIQEKNPTIPYEHLRSKLCQLMGPDFTEHEMITIARAFSGVCHKERYDREKLRALVLTELKRFLWDELDRLREYFLQADVKNCGKLSRKDAYTVLKACRVPLDVLVIEKLLDVALKDCNGLIVYDDIIAFLDRSKCPPTDVPPINIKYQLWWASEREPNAGRIIDWCAFNKYLNLEDTIREAIQLKNFDENINRKHEDDHLENDTTRCASDN